MGITLLYFEDCPNWKVADERLTAIAADRDDIRLTGHLVDTPAEAERTRFLGSPSILVDRVDVFAGPGSEVGLSCRRYLTPGGYAAHPRSNSCGRCWPMRERIATIGPIAAVVGAFALCCALPVLLWLGVVGAIAGWSLQSWALIGLGLALAAVGWARWVRSRRQQQSCQGPVPPAPVDAATVQSADSSTDATMRGNNL